MPPDAAVFAVLSRKAGSNLRVVKMYGCSAVVLLILTSPTHCVSRTWRIQQGMCDGESDRKSVEGENTVLMWLKCYERASLGFGRIMVLRYWCYRIDSKCQVLKTALIQRLPEGETRYSIRCEVR